MHVNVNGSWRFVINSYVKISATWRTISGGWVNINGTWRPFPVSQIILTYSSGSGANIFQDAGSPTVPVNVIATFQSGNFFWNFAAARNSAAAPSAPGVTTGGPWPGGSVLQIINNGTISGPGGAGGRGASCSDLSETVHAQAGAAGGVGLDIQLDCTLDNTNGTISGGGGGGGGGQSSFFSMLNGNKWDMAGGGGGGGQGNQGGFGGSGGVGTSSTGSAYGFDASGQHGGDATLSAAGGGLDGVVTTTACNASGNPKSGAGGSGGGLAAAGGGGGAGFQGAAGSQCTQGALQTPGGGGAAGKAIALNGHSLTITGGNNSTQIVGAVS